MLLEDSQGVIVNRVSLRWQACWKWYYSIHFWVKISVSVPLQSVAREMRFIKQSSASTSPYFVVHAHTVPETKGPPPARSPNPSPLPLPHSPFSPCLSTPSETRWEKQEMQAKPAHK